MVGSSRPNIVLILADDLGIGDLGCMNPEARTRTPNLDSLATDGARFVDAHSPSAVCSPTRYGILTGRYCWRTSLQRGVLWIDDPLLIETGRPTIASRLNQFAMPPASGAPSFSGVSVRITSAAAEGPPK